MNKPAWICALLCFTLPLQAVSDSSDTVNERIPVRKAELEEHWQVNCQDTWLDLQQAMTQASAGGCAIPPRLHHEFKLCSYIYQPPGAEPAPGSCPDYRGVSILLRQDAPESRCLSIQKFLENHSSCDT